MTATRVREAERYILRTGWGTLTTPKVPTFIVEHGAITIFRPITARKMKDALTAYRSLMAQNRRNHAKHKRKAGR